ncbi:hypothetical protein AWR27_10670 [Spirosoma montaniterrae]|uniref:Secretion system C-terminal sorting domain-containing protein n=2 Tax=Spirosoma montaniterrae TaxID=1178516 RepID=A0A1P9WWQ6_9BACT|nr:hypothetical protein AWR27_10670 [Spirosoma montaniterrae]
MIGTGGTSRIILDNLFVSNVISQVAGPSCSTDALPVTLTEFSATQSPNDCSVQLNWATSLELTNEKFIVERSSNAQSFEGIGSVAGRGTTNANQRYSFVDSSPLPTAYYRLKQVDADQTSTYSKIIAVVNRCSAGAIVLQYSQQTARLDVLLNQIDAQFPVSLDVYDSSGRRLHHLNVAESQSIASIDTTPFGSRFIIVRIADSGGNVLRSQRLFLPQ